MKSLWLTCAGMLTAALLIAPGTAFAQADGEADGDVAYEGTTSMVIIENINPDQQTNVDLGEEGASQGDISVYTGLLTDGEGNATGRSSGFCITTSVEEKLFECVWTYHLADGTLTIAGTDVISGTDIETHMPVVGGTGIYAGARGLIHEMHNEDETIYTTTVTIANDSLLISTASMTETEGMTETASMTGTEEITETASMTMPTRADDAAGYWNSVLLWADIDEADQAAWNVLGWDETNWESADPSTIPASETTIWEELTPEEQDAAIELGYDEAAWASLLPRTPEGDINEFWIGLDWTDLKYSEKRLWSILGWNADNWDMTAEQPENNEKAWADLTEEEQAAAAQLGYDEATWDATLPQ